MFFLYDMERIVTLHPSFFGPRIHDYVQRQLLSDNEGTNEGSYYIVAILDGSIEISEGRVLPSVGLSEFNVHFRAVVWRPYKGEIMDGLVSSVTESGFFVEVGPMRAFVARPMIPSDIKYDANATPPQFTDNVDQVIERGTQIRIKLKGIRNEVGQMFAVATIKEDYLGILAG